MESMKDRIEAKVLEFSGKLSTQIHLLALRNTFMTILPIMVFGGLSAVISAAPVTNRQRTVFCSHGLALWQITAMCFHGFQF